MKNLCKGLLIALVAASTCGLVTAPKASAQVIETTTTLPGVVDYSTLSSPVVLTEPAVINTTPIVQPTVMTAPAVINTAPMWRDYDYDYGHLFNLGIPGLFNLNLF